MSIQAVGWVLEHSEATLSNRLVLIGIANYADKQGENASVSLDTLAREARLSRRRVVTCVSQLKEQGFIRVRRGEGFAGPGGRTNAYDILGIGREKSSLPQRGGGEQLGNTSSHVPSSSYQGSSDLSDPKSLASTNGNGHRETNGPLFAALVAACGYNNDKLKLARTNIGKHATDLLDLGASCGDVEWLATFIRVRRHRAPTPQLITSMYPQLDELHDELAAYDERLAQAQDIADRERRRRR